VRQAVKGAGESRLFCFGVEAIRRLDEAASRSLPGPAHVRHAVRPVARLHRNNGASASRRSAEAKAEIPKPIVFTVGRASVTTERSFFASLVEFHQPRRGPDPGVTRAGSGVQSKRQRSSPQTMHRKNEDARRSACHGQLERRAAPALLTRCFTLS